MASEKRMTAETNSGGKNYLVEILTQRRALEGNAYRYEGWQGTLAY